jgi:hypothetical protein
MIERRMILVHLHWWWSQYVSSKRQYPPTKLHSIITGKTTIWTVSAVRASKLTSLRTESGKLQQVLASRVILGSRSHGTYDFILLSDGSVSLQTLLRPSVSFPDRVRVTLRLAVCRQSFLATSPLRLTTSNFISQLNTCNYSPYVTSSLTRGWVCGLQLLLVISSAVILGYESRGTHDHILLSQIRNFPQEQGGPVIAPGTEFPSRCLLLLSRLLWRYSSLPPLSLSLRSK